MDTYTTISGDTWDKIARAVFSDELKADQLMKDPANITLLDYQVFPSGVTVHIPSISEADQYESDLPDWRK